MSSIPRKRFIAIAIGSVCMLLGILAGYFLFSQNAEPPVDNVQNAMPDRLFPKKASKNADAAAKDDSCDIEATFEEIEKIRTATDSWAGMNYQLRLYIKLLDDNRERLTPEQLERLHMYQQETPDWADVDQ